MKESRAYRFSATKLCTSATLPKKAKPAAARLLDSWLLKASADSAVRFARGFVGGGLLNSCTGACVYNLTSYEINTPAPLSRQANITVHNHFTCIQAAP